MLGIPPKTFLWLYSVVVLRIMGTDGSVLSQWLTSATESDGYWKAVSDSSRSVPRIASAEVVVCKECE